jgi:hypothetical protein
MLSTINTSETPKKWGFSALAQNETVYYRYGNRTSYAVSLGEITIRHNNTPGSESLYTIQVNVTAKNNGTIPIDVIFLTYALKDDSGNGCQSDTRFWCGAADLEMNPGESKTGTSSVTISSTKGYDYVSSQRFLLEAIIDFHSDEWGGINKNAWLVDVKKPA